MMFIVARTTSGRPSLQHAVDGYLEDTTSCGLDITGWSRAYQSIPIPQILCKKCGRTAAKKGKQ